jgi:Ca2+-binding EF-hand superfamily protein
MKSNTRLALLIAAAAALAAPAFSQQGTPPSPEERAATFDKSDANKDGKIDKTEFKTTIPAEYAAQVDDARLEMMFTRRDADKDGALTKAEFTAPMQRPGGQ